MRLFTQVALSLSWVATVIALSTQNAASEQALVNQIPQVCSNLIDKMKGESHSVKTALGKP
jgi:hypothetical protein